MSEKVGEKLLYCSFCGKSQHEVRKLIAGPSVFICDECIDLCNDIIREEAQADPGTKTSKNNLMCKPPRIIEHDPWSYGGHKFAQVISRLEIFR